MVATCNISFTLCDRGKQHLRSPSEDVFTMFGKGEIEKLPYPPPPLFPALNN